MKVRILASSALLALLPMQSASAAVPPVDMICGADIAVRAEAGGPVFINGAEAALETFNDNYYEAKSGGITVSLAVNTDGSPDLSYTGEAGVNGICQPSAAAGEAGGVIPFFNAECPTDLSVHADEGGPVYVNGKEAEVTVFNPQYFEAKLGDAVISVSRNADATLDISYTSGRANGICTLD